LGHSQYLVKEISQTTIELFDFRYLDTANIAIIDFSKTFTNYEVQSTNLQSVENPNKKLPDLVIHYI